MPESPNHPEALYLMWNIGVLTYVPSSQVWVNVALSPTICMN